MFGYVQHPARPSQPSPICWHRLLNANLTAWRSAPQRSRSKRLTIDWIKQILVSMRMLRLFVSGGSMANLAALPRPTGQGPPDLTSKAHNLAASDARLYLEETHHSVVKAAFSWVLDATTCARLAVDESFKIRIGDLVAKITEDVESRAPCRFAWVANAARW